jgi:hypothetical protein
MRISRSTGVMCGLLIMLLGAWGALIPFIGPYFDYSFGVNSTWHFTSDRLWLDILPGAVAILGGLLLVVAATRVAGAVGGWLAVVAGAWYVIGPAVSLTWERGQGPIGRPLYGSTRQMLELVGYFYGLGALIVALAAFAIGRFASRPALAEEAAVASRRRAAVEPVAPAMTSRQPLAHEPAGPIAASGQPLANEQIAPAAAAREPAAGEPVGSAEAARQPAGEPAAATEASRRPLAQEPRESPPPAPGGVAQAPATRERPRLTRLRGRLQPSRERRTREQLRK